MKNELFVNIDTDRSPVIQIGKPSHIQAPDTEEAANQMVLDDMATLCEALCTLIHVAHDSGYKDGSESLRDCIKHLEEGFVDSSYETNTKLDENLDQETE